MSRTWIARGLLVIGLPALSALAAFQATAAGALSDARLDALPAATSDFKAVGMITLPFLALGMMVAAAYRRGVALYQRRCHERLGRSPTGTLRCGTS